MIQIETAECGIEAQSGQSSWFHVASIGKVNSVYVVPERMLQNPGPKPTTFFFREISEKHRLNVGIALKYFAKHVRDGSWGDACLFQANVGRSLSLGDFARVNVARADLPRRCRPDEAFYLAMARAIIANQREILDLSPDPEDVVFCCSSADSEVGLVWSMIEGAEQSPPAYPEGRADAPSGSAEA